MQQQQAVPIPPAQVNLNANYNNIEVNEEIIPGAEEQQNAADRQLLHMEVIEMFPDHDLSRIIEEYGHMTSEGLASLVIDRIGDIPRKRGTKRKATNNKEGSPESVQSESDSSTHSSDDIGDLLIDKFLGELIHKIKSEIRNTKNNNDINKFDSNKRKFITNKFTGTRTDFVDKMLDQFNWALVPTAIACFIAENNFANKLQKLAPNLHPNFWLKSGIPMNRKRKFNPIQSIGKELQAEYARYIDIMHEYQQGEYAALLTSDLRLSQQYNQIRWERTETEETMECLVCYEKRSLQRMIFCSVPIVPQRAFFADQESFKEMREPETLENQPGTSNIIRREDSIENDHNDLEQKNKKEIITVSDNDNKCEWSIINIGDDGNTDSSTHPFCHACIRGQANAATEQQPLADGGVGLCCMVPGCKNPILYSEVRCLLSREIRKKLDDRIMQENLGMALLKNLEKCKRCNFAIEMEIDKTINKVFQCLQCDAKFCRICENDWDDDHFGISCKELDQKLKNDRKDRDLEKKLNEAVIRKCPRCGVAFMKDQGCNKMTCRCGMTSCYICRETAINYSHFCQHIRDPDNPKWKCTECNKTCLLYEDAKKKDDQLIAQIRQDAANEILSTNQEDQPTTSNALGAEQNAHQLAGVNHGQNNHRNRRPPQDPRQRQGERRQQWAAHIRNRANEILAYAQPPVAPNNIEVATPPLNAAQLPLEPPFNPVFDQNLLNMRALRNHNMPLGNHNQFAHRAVPAAAVPIQPEQHQFYLPQNRIQQPHNPNYPPPLRNLFQQIIYPPPQFNNNNNNNNGNFGAIAAAAHLFQAIPPQNRELPPLPPEYVQLDDIPLPPLPPHNRQEQSNQQPMNLNVLLQRELELFDQHMDRFRMLADADNRVRAALEEARAAVPYPPMDGPLPMDRQNQQNREE